MINFSLQEFRCADGEKCIAEFQKCNHRKECTDGSDEENCSKCLHQLVAQEQELAIARGGFH